MTERPHLRELADRLGILSEFTGADGRRRVASDATREQLLLALGFEAAEETGAARAIAHLDADLARTIVDPVNVVHSDDPAARRLSLRAPQAGAYGVTIRDEHGVTQSVEGAITEPADAVEVSLPELGSGYFDIDVVVDMPGGELSATQRRITHPGTAFSVARATGEKRSYGLNVNLYALRGDADWGVGDMGDLDDLVTWTAEIGASFVGISPLHALRNCLASESPYFPESRIFRNPIYLDINAIPELTLSTEARRYLASADFQHEMTRLRSSNSVNYQRVWNVKCRALRLLYATFCAVHGSTDTDRGWDFRRYCAEQGEALSQYAARLAESDSAGEIGFHEYLQFELDRQLGDTARRARKAGLEIGLYNDLAIGVAPDGADALAYPDDFVDGARIGAPPDPYAPRGQDWGLLPFNPLRMKETGYGYWIRTLRANMRHAGALRIDHIMGLDRQYWIPDGERATDGAYVRFPFDDLLGILALESQRHNTVIVGETLGTLPPNLVDRLHATGILSSQVLYFERESDGSFRPGTSYSGGAMVTANTHDLPTLAGFWSHGDLELRRKTDLTDDEETARLHGERGEAKQALRRRFVAEGIVSDEDELETPDALGPAVYQFLGSTPAPLVGIAFDDLAGEADPVNVPGAAPERFEPWTRRNKLSVAEVRESPLARGIIDAVRRAGRGVR